MLPYPSGRIHMGHVRNYCIGDVLARFYRMRGHHVLHPMGWDAFGMPAENAAIERGKHPADWTLENIATMKVQLAPLGFSYDWSREVTTCEPEYYRWEQLIFTQMFEKGLVYKKSAVVNWCARCSTVLANEQVEDGGCWRCGTAVVQQERDQWFSRITAYADELLEATASLASGWPDKSPQDAARMDRQERGSARAICASLHRSAGQPTSMCSRPGPTRCTALRS